MKRKDIKVGEEYAFSARRTREGLQDNGYRVRVIETNVEQVVHQRRTHSTVESDGILVQHLDPDTGEELELRPIKVDDGPPRGELKKKQAITGPRYINMPWDEYVRTILDPTRKKKQTNQDRINTDLKALETLVEVLGLPDGSYEINKGYDGNLCSRASLLHITGDGAQAILEALRHAVGE